MIHQIISVNNSWSVTCLQSVGHEHIDTWNSSPFGCMQRMIPKRLCLTFRIFFSNAISLHYMFQLDFAQIFCFINFRWFWVTRSIMYHLGAAEVSCSSIHKNWKQEDLQMQVRPNFWPYWMFSRPHVEVTSLCCSFGIILLLINFIVALQLMWQNYKPILKHRYRCFLASVHWFFCRLFKEHAKSLC